MYYGPAPLPLMIFAIAGFFIYLYKHRTPARKCSETLSTPSPEEKSNVLAMEKVVAAHEGYSAEVFNVSVFGRRKVETFRLLSQGDKVELRLKKGCSACVDVMAFGEYITDFIPDLGSNLLRLLKEKRQFDAYLGGRDLAFSYDDTCDFCSVIIFFKLDGVPPTHVNLK